MAEIYTTTSIIYNFLKGNFSSESDLTTKYPDLTSRIERIQDEIDHYIKYTFSTRTFSDYYTDPHYPSQYKRDFNYMRINLPHRKIISLTKFQVFNGDTYDDWLTTKTEGRNEDYWMDYTHGRLYINSPWGLTFYKREKTVILSYTYGEGATETDRTNVPKDIERAATYLVVEDMLMNDDYTMIEPEGGDSIRIQDKIEMYHKKAYEILDRYVEFSYIG